MNGQPNVLSSCGTSLLDTLRQFKPSEKPKLSHMVMSDGSSSDESPVQRNPVIVNLDSDSDENEVIVCDDSDDGSIKPKAESDNSKTNSDQTGSQVGVSEIEPAASSDDEVIRTLKRKKQKPAAISNKKRIKRRKRSDDESDDNADGGDQSFMKSEQVYDSDEEESDLPMKTALRKQVVDLLNSENEKDFQAIPGITGKKLEAIMTNRPYSSWADTIEKFNRIKGLNCSMLNGVCDTVIAKETVRELLAKCERLATKTGRKISTVGTLVSKQPSLLNPELTLSSYQLLGLNWLALMRSESLNSILADEMGLGKTIQVIAFLAYLKENELVLPGYPHLVVVPSSTLNNWYDEFQKWCPAMKISIYQGNQDERRYLRHLWFKQGFGDADVILTTYSCATSSREEKKMFRVKEFNYIVFDEAHMLKNMNTQRYEALIQFNGNFKILLTGTPLQNNLLELMSLLTFLMPDLFRNKDKHIKLLFSKCSKTIDEQSTDYEKEKVDQAKRIIEPFMLRRLKEDVLRDLPTKTSTVEKCPLIPEQRKQYDIIVDDFKVDSASRDSNCHMVYFMMLRKMANHPLLLRFHFTEDKLEKMAERLALDPSYKGKNPQYIQEDLYFKSDFELYRMCQDLESLQSLEYTIADHYFCESGKLVKLTPMLKTLKEEGHRVLIFSQFIFMLDILEEYCQILGFSFLRMDGSTQTAVRQEMIDEYNEDNEIFIFLLSTKAGGLGINLTAADTVIIHDIDFNPYNDKQAEDRCHRIGQKRPVQVIKLISENTVEEGIYNTAVKKLYLEKEVTASNDDENADSKTILQLLKESLGMQDPT